MPPTPKEEEKKKSGTEKDKSVPNDREREKAEEGALANAFAAASLGQNAGVANERVAASGGGEDTANPDDPPCDGCKQPFAGTMRCGKCQSAFYCGRDCQLSHWTAGGHKKVCRLLKKKNEETARRVLEQFEEIQDWTDLDDAGAYNAAVRQGLYNKIREVMELDKAKILERYQNGCKGGDEVFYLYTPCVMFVLFRGRRAEGRTTTTFAFTFVDGLRIEGYVRSHRDALDTWLQASVQLVRDVTHRATLRVPDVHGLAHKAAGEVWWAWATVFANATAARAILTPFPSPTAKGAASGGESAEQQRKRGEDHVRGIVKTLGEARRLVFNNYDPDPNTKIYFDLCLVCALVFVRTQEFGIGIDVKRFLNLHEDEKEMFQFTDIPMAKQVIEKGSRLDPQEHAAAMAEANRQWEIYKRTGQSENGI